LMQIIGNTAPIMSNYKENYLNIRYSYLVSNSPQTSKHPFCSPFTAFAIKIKTIGFNIKNKKLYYF